MAYIFLLSEVPKTAIRNLTASLQGGGAVLPGFPSNSIALPINHNRHFDATFLTAYGLMGKLFLVVVNSKRASSAAVCTVGRP